VPVAPSAGPPGSGPAVALDRPSTLPGGTVALAGQGCPSGASVELTVRGARVGRAVADGTGHFSAGLRLPDLPIGAYAVDVTCAGLHSSVPIDLVVASSGPIAGSVAATAAAVLVFFVLLGGMLLYRDQGVRRRLDDDDPEGAADTR
jgi:hypothetical protein